MAVRCEQHGVRGDSARVRRSVRAILAVRTTLLTFCSSYSQSSLYGVTRRIDPGEPMKASPFAGALAIVLVSFARAQGARFGESDAPQNHN